MIGKEPANAEQWMQDQEDVQVLLGYFFRELHQIMEAAVYTGIGKHFKKNNG